MVAIRGPDEFCGEGALTGKPLRLATATTMSTCEIVRMEKQSLVRFLHQNSDFADYFLDHLLTGPPELKRTWLTNCLIQARCGWRGPFCYWPILATTFVRNRYP